MDISELIDAVSTCAIESSMLAMAGTDAAGGRGRGRYAVRGYWQRRRGILSEVFFEKKKNGVSCPSGGPVGEDIQRLSACIQV
jgi:hypothetical protein